MSNLNIQSPPVRVQGIPATPLKHTSPVPLGIANKNTPRGQDPLTFLAGASPRMATPPSRVTAPIPQARLSPHPGSGSFASPIAFSLGNGNIEQMTRDFLLTGAAPPPIDLRSYEGPGGGIGKNLNTTVTFLLSNCAWQQIVDVTNEQAEGFAIQQDSVHGDRHLSFCMSARLQAMFRLKMFDELAVEVTSVLQGELVGATATENSPLTSVQLQMLLLHMECKSTTGRSEEALEELISLHAALSVPSSCSPTEVRRVFLWKWRVKSAIVNVALKHRLVKLAQTELFVMLQEIMSLQNSDSHNKIDLKKAEVVVRCRISRLFLHQGALKLGISHCDKAMALVASTELETDDSVSSQVHFTRGLALFSIGDYNEAIKIFSDLVQKLRSSEDNTRLNNISVPTSTAGAVVALELGDSPTQLAATINALAVCALNLKDIGASVARLERLILGDPARFMTDPIVFNLCTLYDLSCSQPVSSSKKQVLKCVADMYHIQGALNQKSYRL